MKIMVIGIENENQLMIRVASDTSMESIVNGQAISWYSIASMIVLYVLAYLLMMKFIANGDAYGFE